MKIIIVTGQTATGKTQLALKLAEKYNGELINCDSRQVYRQLNIITGKDITKESKFKLFEKINNYNIGYYLINKRKVWLYDIINPKYFFSSFDWTQCCIYLINKLIDRKITPIIVGGTYLYLYHLLYTIQTENIPPNWTLRKELNRKTVPDMQKILSGLNIQSFNRLNNSDKNNPQRLIRKIEILSSAKIKQITGSFKPALYRLSDKLNRSNIEVEFFGINFKDKNDLKNKIKLRVTERINIGAVNEVKNLLKKGYTESDPGLKTIGYVQLIKYLKGKLSLKEAIDMWINKEMQYAKRQLTFMKKDPHIKWQEI